MSRRRQATKKPLTEDAKYHSPLVTRLVNTVMACGKKTVAQRIVYGAFDQIARTGPFNPRKRESRLHFSAFARPWGLLGSSAAEVVQKHPLLHTAETVLPAWGGRTRTRKCVCEP